MSVWYGPLGLGRAVPALCNSRGAARCCSLQDGSPTDHWVEMVTALGASGVEVLVAYSTIAKQGASAWCLLGPCA